MLVSTYEKIIENLPKEVQRIAEHLNIYLDAHPCQISANDYTIEIQQERIKTFREELLQLQRNPNDHREIVDYHAEGSLLHRSHPTQQRRGERD